MKKKERFSSLYIGILAATILEKIPSLDDICFSSLYIGILAATTHKLSPVGLCIFVSVPFTSGSSLQQYQWTGHYTTDYCFSSLYIGILAATEIDGGEYVTLKSFSSLYIGILAATGCS